MQKQQHKLRNYLNAAKTHKRQYTNVLQINKLAANTRNIAIKKCTAKAQNTTKKDKYRTYCTYQTKHLFQTEMYTQIEAA